MPWADGAIACFCCCIDAFFANRWTWLITGLERKYLLTHSYISRALSCISCSRETRTNALYNWKIKLIIFSCLSSKRENGSDNNLSLEPILKVTAYGWLISDLFSLLEVIFIGLLWEAWEMTVDFDLLSGTSRGCLPSRFWSCFNWDYFRVLTNSLITEKASPNQFTFEPKVSFGAVIWQSLDSSSLPWSIARSLQKKTEHIAETYVHKLYYYSLQETSSNCHWSIRQNCCTNLVRTNRNSWRLQRLSKVKNAWEIYALKIGQSVTLFDASSRVLNRAAECHFRVIKALFWTRHENFFNSVLGWRHNWYVKLFLIYYFILYFITLLKWFSVSQFSCDVEKDDVQSDHGSRRLRLDRLSGERDRASLRPDAAKLAKRSGGSA